MDLKFEPKEFGVVIIESLDENEKKTGQILFNEVLNYKQIKEPNLTKELFVVSNAQEFLEAMKAINGWVRDRKFFPLIHIEAHGSTDGIHLSNGDVVVWTELFSISRSLNITLKNSLVMMLAMCEGATYLGRFEPDKRAPFLAAIACFNKIDSNKLLNVYEVFYDHFFFNLSLLDAVNEMNRELDDNKSVFHLLKSDYMFDQMMDENRDPVHFQKVIDQVAVKQKATNSLYKNIDYDTVRSKIESQVVSLYKEVREQKDYFMMKDL